ncbi:MAG: CDGSH iron-sulfur domain-containing protein [Dysgonamonadaceae bacterium]|jgi:CDGSH-type Zn-finger protein|nr:CDGSH iron-sulfur domain-containing protein [Dysgonamonadaceae bacterium]
MEPNNSVQKGSHAAPETYYILIEKDGPYLVYGKPPINQEIITPDATSFSWTYRKGISIENTEEPIALCRCGQSKHKPCCDGTHTYIDWDGSETASKDDLLANAKPFKGADFILHDDGRKYCATARFCDGYGDIWHLVKKPLTDEQKEIVEHQATHCPSGRLVLVNQATGEIYEPQLDPSIGILEDPVMKVSGPIWVKGGIRVQGADGSCYEVRNRVTLCRCGRSANKPLCDSSHVKVEFRDGMMA